jgi:uncharacterized membrane protein required for colicin V production
MIQFLSEMTALDLLLIFVWLAAMIYGWRTGLFRQVFLLGAVIIGILLAFAIAPGASFWTGTFSSAGKATMLPFTYAFLVLFIGALVYVVLLRTYPYTRINRYAALDRVAGVLMGAIVGLVVITEIWVILLLVTDGQWAVLDGARSTVRQQLSNTPFLPFLAETFSLIVTPIRSLVPTA